MLYELDNPVGGYGNAGIKPFSNGLAVLKSLDSNNDNQFTGSDAAWNNVKVWIDANHDGKSFIDSNNNGIFDAGEQTELKTLAELGIAGAAAIQNRMRRMQIFRIRTWVADNLKHDGPRRGNRCRRQKQTVTKSSIKKHRQPEGRDPESKKNGF